MGEPSTCPQVRLAYGVTLRATNDGMLVEDDRLHRVRLGEPTERWLVERLAHGHLSDIPAEHANAVTTLLRLGALVPALPPLAVLDRLDIPLEITREVRFIPSGSALCAGEHVLLIADRRDPRLVSDLDAVADLRAHAVVVWASPGETVAVMDDPSAGPCARCALFFDARGPRLVEPVAGAVVASSAHATLERALTAAVAGRYAAHESPLAPGIASVWDSRAGTAALHSFPAHPSCPCARRPRRAGPPFRPQADWQAFQRARFSPVIPLSEREGVVRAAYRSSRGPSPLTVGSFGVAIAAGEQAPLRATAEAIERFAMMHAVADRTDRSMASLDEPTLSAEEIRQLLYRDEEVAAPGFRFGAFDAEVPLAWSWAERASTGARLLVPTSLVGRPPLGSARLADATSNGYACHSDREEAKLRAVLEIVERDAVLLRWYTSEPPLRLAVPGDTSDVRLFLATVDVDLPVVVAATFWEGALRIGSAAATSFEIARARALEELSGQRFVPPSSSVPTTLDAAARGYAPRDHVAHYEGERGRALLDEWADATSLPVAEARTRWPAEGGLSAALDALRRTGLDALFVDRSIPELFGDGWSVIRALVPGTVEMSWGMPYRRLASPRLEKALSLGGTLCPRPHPYA